MRKKKRYEEYDEYDEDLTGEAEDGSYEEDDDPDDEYDDSSFRHKKKKKPKAVKQKKPKGKAAKQAKPVKSKKDLLSESDRFTLQTVGKYMLPIGITAAVALILILMTPVLAGDKTQEIADKTEQLSKLTNENEALQLELKQLESEANTSIAGVYVGKDNDPQWQLDDEKASAFFAGITTWSDGTSYDQIRKRMIDSGYQETDSVMTCFLPKMNDDWKLDESGETLYVREIDEKGMNCAYEGMTSYRIYTDGAESRYAAIVDMTSRDTSGSGMTVEAHAYVKYTVDAATGALSGVEAYVLDEV